MGYPDNSVLGTYIASLTELCSERPPTFTSAQLRVLSAIQLSTMHFDIPVPSGQTVALMAVLITTAHLLVLRATTMRNIDTYSSGQQDTNAQPHELAEAHPSTSPGLSLPRSLPSFVMGKGDPTTYVLSHERLVSKPVQLSSRKRGDCPIDELLTHYVRATMTAFAYTPQAYILRKMVPPRARETFEAAHINAMSFTHNGARVDGVYVVEYRGLGAVGERVEMRLSPPEGYTGPEADGLIIAAVEPVGDGADKVVFANETWLWRRLDEKPTMLEGVVERWFHSLLAAWLIGKGISAVKASPVLGLA